MTGVCCSSALLAVNVVGLHALKLHEGSAVVGWHMTAEVSTALLVAFVLDGAELVKQGS